jgi:hypothetical protein
MGARFVALAAALPLACSEYGLVSKAEVNAPEEPAPAPSAEVPAEPTLPDRAPEEPPPDDPPAVDTGDVAVPPPEEPPAPPDVAADPSAIGRAGVCGEANATVTVANEGASPLTVQGLTLTGAGWSLDEVALPAVLDPGATLAVGLRTTGGDARLDVLTDDPDEPVLTIPLSATPDAPPTARIASPGDGAVVGEGAALALVGVVGDDLDAPSALAVAWTASADGALVAGPTLADGTTAVDWPAAARASGPQTVTLAVTDACGQTATDTVALCQDGAVTWDALDLTGWHFEGVAAWDDDEGWLVLTHEDEFLVGTAFETSAPVNAENVTLEVLFWIGGGTGADGISVTALDVERMDTFLGGDGCGIGYGGDASCTDGPALPGWSIEVDTWYNRGQDPTREDHLAFSFDGDVDDPEVWVELPEMEDNGWHLLTVDVVAPRVTVAVDGVGYIDEDIDGYWDFPAYVGLTAGTGGSTNWHVVDALEVTDYACD